MVSTVFEPIDGRIVGILRANGRISWRELGEQVHLAPSSVAERVRRLEARGVITGYSARVDPVAVGRTVRAVVDVSLVPGNEAEEFEARLAERDEIVMAAYVTGSSDYTIVAECVGAEGLDGFVRWMRADTAVGRTDSKVILRSVIG